MKTYIFSLLILALSAFTSTTAAQNLRVTPEREGVKPIRVLDLVTGDPIEGAHVELTNSLSSAATISAFTNRDGLVVLRAPVFPDALRLVIQGVDRHHYAAREVPPTGPSTVYLAPYRSFLTSDIINNDVGTAGQWMSLGSRPVWRRHQGSHVQYDPINFQVRVPANALPAGVAAARIRVYPRDPNVCGNNGFGASIGAALGQFHIELCSVDGTSVLSGQLRRSIQLRFNPMWYHPNLLPTENTPVYYVRLNQGDGLWDIQPTPGSWNPHQGYVTLNIRRFSLLTCLVNKLRTSYSTYKMVRRMAYLRQNRSQSGPSYDSRDEQGSGGGGSSDGSSGSEPLIEKANCFDFKSEKQFYIHCGKLSSEVKVNTTEQHDITLAAGLEAEISRHMGGGMGGISKLLLRLEAEGGFKLRGTADGSWQQVNVTKIEEHMQKDDKIGGVPYEECYTGSGYIGHIMPVFKIAFPDPTGGPPLFDFEIRLFGSQVTIYCLRYDPSCDCGHTTTNSYIHNHLVVTGGWQMCDTQTLCR